MANSSVEQEGSCATVPGQSSGPARVIPAQTGQLACWAVQPVQQQHAAKPQEALAVWGGEGGTDHGNPRGLGGVRQFGSARCTNAHPNKGHHQNQGNGWDGGQVTTPQVVNLWGGREGGERQKKKNRDRETEQQQQQQQGWGGGAQESHKVHDTPPP